jgi:hypothetical protein
MSEPKFNEFNIPRKTLDQIYELSGGSKAYKGFIIAYATEKGEPVIHTKCDSQMTEYGLRRSLEAFLTESTEPFEVEDQ